MNGPSKRQADPDAPARPCLFYAACSKYSIKAQVRRVTRKAAIPRATTKAVSLKGMNHGISLRRRFAPLKRTRRHSKSQNTAAAAMTAIA